MEFSTLNGYKVKDKKAIRFYDNVESMKSDTSLKSGMHVKTKGYYTPGDGGQAEYIIVNDNNLVEDNGLIHVLNNELRAKLLDKKVNVKQFGAKGDGTNDDSIIFNNAIESLDSDYKVLYIPNGIYIINDSVVLKSDISLIGESKYLTKLKQGNNMLSKPLLITDISNNTQIKNIYIENITIESEGERTCFPVEIYNTHSSTIRECLFNQDQTSESYFHGLLIDKYSGFNGNVFVNKIIDCRFSQSKIKINSTDSYILHNEIWGNNLDCAIELVNASTTSITNNEIVGGKVYGGIYISSSNEALKITSNYFDGSYNNIDTKYGIYGNELIKHSVINNNTFWRQKSGAIYLKKSQSNTINGNTFEENDYYNTGASDIEIVGSSETFNNIISNNTFFRNKYYNTTSQTTVDRPTTNLTPIMKITNTSGYQASIVSNNTCSYIQYYGASVFNGNIISRNNTSDRFFYTYNYAHTSIKNDKDIIYTDNSNLLTNKTSAVINGSLTRIDNIKVIMSSSLGSFDFNGSNNESYKVYINSTSGVTNLPSFFNNNGLVEYEFIASGYGKQTFTGYDSSNNLINKTRLMINGSWGSWN